MSKSEGTRSRSVSQRLSAVFQNTSFFDACTYKLVNLFFYAAFGSTLVYLPLYFKYIGLNAAQVGVLTGIRPFIQVIGAPIGGFLADKFKKRKLIVVIALSAFALKHLGILVAHTPNQTCLKTNGNGSHLHSANNTNLPRGIVDLERGNLRRNLSEPDFNIKRTISRDGNEHFGIHLDTTSSPVNKENTKQNDKYRPKGQDSEYFEDGEMINEEENLLEKIQQEQNNEMHVEDTRRTRRHVVLSSNSSNEKLQPTKSRIIRNQNDINKDFIVFLFIILVCELVGSCMLSLVDGAVVEFLGEERNNYGNFRLWGSLGICIASITIGAVIQQNFTVYCDIELKDYRISFYFLFGFSFLGLLAFMNTKHVYSENIRKMESDISKLKEIFSGFRNISFWMIVISLGIIDGFQMDFGPWFLDDLGTSPALVGVATSLHFVVNAFTYMFSNHIINRLGYMNTLTLGLCLYAVVFIGFSFARVPWVAMVLFALVGSVSTLTWSCGVTYVAMVASPFGIVSTAEG